MKLCINGEDQELLEGVFSEKNVSPKVADLLGALELQVDRVAVAVNGSIVHRAQHPVHVLSDGDRIEVVTLVGGG